MLTASIVLHVLLLGQVVETQDKERPYWLEVAKAHIEDCEVKATKGGKTFIPVREPIFHHVQNTRGKSVGSVFLFVDDLGRPGAIGDVFMFPKGKQHQLYNEWHTLASVPLMVKWEGVSLISETESALTWRMLADSPVVPESRTARQRQMRDIARRFTANLIDRMDDKFELRLLTTPLYQYPAENQKVDKDDPLGGGLFTFCQETDPEIFLLLEARQTDKGAKWHYAAAEFSNLRLFMQLDGKEVWAADPPQFSSAGPHFGGKLKDVELQAPPQSK